MRGLLQRHLLLATTLFVVALVTEASVLGQESDTRPNIVLLLVDDQRNDALGCAGNAIIRTPAIDMLAAQGVRFSNAFVTTPICAASRASILTGLHERTHGYTFGTAPVRPDHAAASYPSLLRRAGYRTGFVGKYGIRTEGPAEADLFDFFAPHGLPFLNVQPDGSVRHETEIAGDRAIEFLNAHPKDQPFCLSISFNAAHADDGNKKDHYPWPRAVDGLYENVTIPPPRLSAPEIFDNLPPFLKASMNRHRYFWRWDTPDKYERNMRAYFRMISGIDHVVDRIRRELEVLQLADDTIIIYTADNGYYMGDRGFAGKWSHFEQSLRVPMIVFDPRPGHEERGKVRTELVLNIDLAPTILDFADVEIPEHYQGRSMRRLLPMQNIAGDWREGFFCEHLMDHRDIPKWEGVRGERFVYARYFEQDPVYEFLHDLKTDPDQLVNLAELPAYADLIAQMRSRCDKLKRTLERSDMPQESGRGRP